VGGLRFANIDAKQLTDLPPSVSRGFPGNLLMLQILW
jgi:hypothetical protein